MSHRNPHRRPIDGPSPPLDTAPSYQEARARAGRSPEAHSGDPVETCNDPTDSQTSKVIGSGTVLIGG